MIDWEDFRLHVSDERFLLPLDTFMFELRYVPIRPQPDHHLAAVQSFSSDLMDAVRTVPDSSLSALEVRMGEGGLQPADGYDGNQASLLSASYGLPVYDFGALIGPSALQIIKRRATIEELIRTAPIMIRLMNLGFQNNRGEPSTFSILGIPNRIYSVRFRFSYRLSVTSKISDSKVEVDNNNLARKLIRLDIDKSVENPGHSNPLGALNPEVVRRADATISFDKTLNDRKRSLWVIYEGPYNVTQRDVDLTFSCHTTEQQQIDLTDVVDWDIAFTHFLRDLVLNRFLPDLFHDIRAQSRP